MRAALAPAARVCSRPPYRPPFLRSLPPSRLCEQLPVAGQPRGLPRILRLAEGKRCEHCAPHRRPEEEPDVVLVLRFSLGRALTARSGGLRARCVPCGGGGG